MNFTLCKNRCNYTNRNKQSHNPPSLRPNLPKPHYPLLRTKLASLVKGRWLDGTTQTVACCVLIATHPPFLFTKLFCRQDGGIAIPPSLAPHQLSQNRTIPLAFRRASVCVCLYGFASVQNSGHTRLRHPCLACPSRCTNLCCFH